MRSTAPAFDTIHETIAEVPVVDTHEHHEERSKTADIMVFIADGYFGHDLASAAGDAALATIVDGSRSLDERWPVFDAAYRAARHTGYGLMVRYGLERVFGDGWHADDPVTLENLNDWQHRIPDYSQAEVFEQEMKDAGVAARITDNWPSLSSLTDGSATWLPGQHPAISLPQFHTLRSHTQIAAIERAAGGTVTSLDEYVLLCADLFEKWKAQGAVCFKDQSAYQRSLAYSYPSKAEAETVFNRMLTNPRAAVEWGDDGHSLSDYLMHRFMQLARDMDLPVQLHTGHMAGNYNDVAKANAAKLRPLLETHKQVRFNLFHANWPYSGDVLFLVKNYPNVTLNFCWTHQVDPLYAKELLKQSVSAVPVSKIHGVGSDVNGGQPHLTFAHVRLAKQLIASALAELVEIDFITETDATQIAKLWLYTNAREFFALPIVDCCWNC